MSLRNMRKVYGAMEIPAPDSNTDDEYEPSCTQKHDKNVYEGLEVSSNSENENNASEEPVVETPAPVVVNKKKLKRMRRQRKMKEKLIEMDEIDKSLQEVNAILGEPVQLPKAVVKEDTDKVKRRLFTVKQQNFDPVGELIRNFGPCSEDVKKPGRQPNLRAIAQKGFIIDTDKIYKRNGLTMVLKERKNGLTYFVFQHSRDYQEMHRAFLVTQDGGPSHLDFSLEESQRRMHVEGMLETADRLYFMEEYTRGNKIIEQVISFMQQSAHPFFSVTDIRVRLPYEYVENRPFHIALMKYMHMLTNKACHRTALELAKLLLNLDPKDPLAVLLIIDTIAIRAKEYKWLVEAIDYWKEEREAGYMFNMQYSYALAHFHIAMKNKAGLEEADELIQQAMLRFPSVITNMFQNAGIRNPRVQECPLFKEDPDNRTCRNLANLITLYARLIWNKFREDAVLKWLTRNINELANNYENVFATRRYALAYTNLNRNVFQVYPDEISRHLSILTPLNNLIADGAVPEIDDVVAYDPVPAPYDIDNRYARSANVAERYSVYQFFTSMLPNRD